MKTSNTQKNLSIRFTVLVVIVIVLSVFIYLAWSTHMEQRATESKVLAEARTLNTEMQAVWDYVDASQSAINYNSDGTFDFKGIYCSVAGKSIAQRFTQQSEGYTIRYVRENPRSSTDNPDAFESIALEQFSNNGAREYYGISEYEGEAVFRYVSAIEIKYNCLSCHGSPAGETDLTGFMKEGMESGSLAGAVSIVIPLHLYKAEMEASRIQEIIFFLALMVAIVVVIRYALRRWVTQPLAQTNERLQDENEAKSNFLTIMSHELRTPLSSIIAFTDIWEKDGREKSVEEEKLVQEIKENSQVLLEMVNNTIDVARIEAGNFVLVSDEVDLVDIVNTVVRVVEPLAIKKEINLDVQIDQNVPIIESDWDALRKILMNLMSNALKFTNNGGNILVAVHFDEVDRKVIIAVQDTGIGIPEKDFDLIFSRFTQSGFQGASEAEGSGLGLFLVRSLAEKLGGSAKVESTLGVGSTFTVSIPVNSELPCVQE